MAGENRGHADHIEKELLQNGHRFSFFQAVRLLKNLLSTNGDGRTEQSFDKIRIQPNLSLDFPGTNVEKVEKDERENSYSLISNILGLYGTCSPLPTFYTEELFQDVSSGNNTTKDLLDIINQRLYEILYQGWGKYRTMQRILEEKSKVDEQRLFSLVGMGEEELRREMDNPHELLRYTGLLSLGPRSASGLETMLKDALEGINIRIRQCIPQKGVIPEDQQACLGSNINLGLNSLLGKETLNSSGAFKIEVGPLSDSLYRSFLPGGSRQKKLDLLTGLYLSQPLSYELELVLDKDESPGTTRLGSGKRSSLGLDTWVFSDQGPGEYRVGFSGNTGFKGGASNKGMQQ